MRPRAKGLSCRLEDFRFESHGPYGFLRTGLKMNFFSPKSISSNSVEAEP